MRQAKGETTERINDLLRARLEEAGWGSTTRVEDALGLAHGYFRKWRNRGTFDFETLLAALKVLDVHPCEFFAEVFDCDDWTGSGHSAAKPEPERTRPDLRPTGGAETAGVPGWIEELDELRYHDAEAAIRQLWARKDDAEGTAVAHYFGVLGTAYRSIGNLPEARECLAEAEARAIDTLGYGDALQRQSYLAMGDGDLDKALRLTAEAACAYAQSQHWVRYGEVHVDQAQVFGHLGSRESEWRCLDTAELHLKGASRSARLQRYLFAIAQYRGLNRRAAGRLESALRLTRSAAAAAPFPNAEGYCWKLAGQILRDLRRFKEAAQAFKKARELSGSDPYAFLDNTVDIVECLGRCDKGREAYAEALRVSSVVGAFGASPLVSKAAMQLWTQARELNLQATTFARVRSAVQQALASRCPLSTLGARVARTRKLVGATQLKVSEAAGIPAETLRKIESGDVAGTKHQAALERWMHETRPETGG